MRNLDLGVRSWDLGVGRKKEEGGRREKAENATFQLSTFI